MTIAIERDLGHIPIQEFGGVFAFATFETFKDRVQVDEVFCLLDLESATEIETASKDGRKIKKLNVTPFCPSDSGFTRKSCLQIIDRDKLLIIVSLIEGGIRLKACKVWTILIHQVEDKEGLQIGIGTRTFHKPLIGKLQELVSFDKEYDAYHKLYKEIFLPKLKDFQEFETRMCENAKAQKKAARERSKAEKMKRSECIIL